MDYNRFMKRLLAYSLFLFQAVLVVTLCQCEPKQKKTNHTTLNHSEEHNRKELQEELTKIRNDIDRELEKVERRLENSSADNREQLEKADRKLKSNKAKIEKAGGQAIVA